MRLFIYLLVSCHCHELALAFTARPARCSAGTNHCRPYTGATPIRDSSAPSDTASLDDEDAVDTSAIPYEPTTSEALVTNMLDLIPTGGFAGDGAAGLTTEQRAAISEALYRLEAVNPTPRPATSPLINGVWELRYVGGYTADWALPSPTRQLALFLYSGGYSPGVFAYTVAQQLPSALVELQSDDDSSSSSALEITISRAPQPRVEASVAVKLLGGAVSGKVTVRARLEVESDLRLRETYESVTVLGQASPYSIPSQLQYARDLYVTYLDDDLLVVRDGSGVPEVLVRKAKKFSRNWGTEPSAINDMVPPGDGEDAQF
jgi:PAP_fibrillin